MKVTLVLRRATLDDISSVTVPHEETIEINTIPLKQSSIIYLHKMSRM